MKTALMIAMVAMLVSLGVARAETMKAGPDFDRVGLASTKPQPGAHGALLKPAPGEHADPGVADYPARKREMARRLLWLMLSAR